MTRRERLAIGSNQHRSRRKWYHSTYLCLLILPLLVAVGLPSRSYGLQALSWLDEATTVRSVYASSELEAQVDLPLVEEPTPTPTPKTVPQDSSGGGVPAEQQEIESYIREVFGDAGDIAVAVSRRECSPHNASYPHCVLHTEHEYSVGVYQINLFNSRGWVHAGKVPGDAMSDKIDWAQDWRNNVQLAKEIHDAWGSFQPWTAFTNGAYLHELEGGEQ